jgi:uncharacterized membrane protein
MQVVGKCVICGEYDARYVCESCGRSVCKNCFDSKRWVCTDCLSKIVGRMGQPTESFTSYPQNRLLPLFFTGFLIVFIGMALMIVSSLFSEAGSVLGGAVVFIGPIPIILGSGPISLHVFTLAIILTVIGVIFFVRDRRR